MATDAETTLADVFFAYVDREEASAGLNGSAPLSTEAVQRRLRDYQGYLDHHPLSASERQELLKAYEGYLLMQCVLRGSREDR